MTSLDTQNRLYLLAAGVITPPELAEHDRRQREELERARKSQLSAKPRKIQP